jgi:hypothetical protein
MGHRLGRVILGRQGALEAWLNRSCSHPHFLSLNGAAGAQLDAGIAEQVLQLDRLLEGDV